MESTLRSSSSPHASSDTFPLTRRTSSPSDVRRSASALYRDAVTTQRLRLVVPPTLPQLLEDDVYARYFRRDPVMPVGAPRVDPWQIIARRAPDAPGSTWAVGRMPSYADAYRRVRRMAGSSEWEDVAICSRGVMFRPPLDFEWNLRFHWCGRCRRPSLFQPMLMHPVVASQIDDSLRAAAMLVSEKPERCYYCGMSRSGMPRYSPRRRDN